MKKATATLLSVFFIVPMWMNFLLRTYAWKVLLGAFTDVLYTEAAVLLGDRLYTDIACAVNAGIDSVFVLSGEGTRDDIERDGIRPTWVYDDINAVFRAWEETP